jgi:hypothetical protein
MPARNRIAPSAIAPNWPSALKYEVIPQAKSKPPRTNKTIAKRFLIESSVLRHILNRIALRPHMVLSERKTREALR